MKEYKGYKYEQQKDGSWKVEFPGGGKMKTPKQTEEHLKAEIDKHEEER